MSLKILIFPGSTEIGLELQRALHQVRDVVLISAGSPGSNHAPFVYSHHMELPDVNDPEWLPAINRLIDKEGINYIFPAHDDVIVALARNTDNLHAPAITSPLATCELTRSKRLTYSAFASLLPVPMLYDHPDDIPDYPVFLKPERGQGSQDSHIVFNRIQLDQLLARRSDFLICEYLPGEELTVDCFSDRERGLLFCKGRHRVRTRNGISMASIASHNPHLNQFARVISDKIQIYGAWFFQVKRDQAGNFRLLEIAPRVAGAMCFHRVQGVNFPLLSLYEHQRIPLQIVTNEVDVELDRALTNRYRHNLQYSAVYIDLDDTLVLAGKVNTELVRFLYQCLNRGIGLHLITKHASDLTQTLRRYRLDGLFDTIVHIDQSASKADYIREADAIFIDDSFRERLEVHERQGIPTFDNSMIELLLDERV